MSHVHPTRVLSIQSHVVHGGVGNSAAAFPMQLHGIDIDTFNILSFSNHTGYPTFKGHRFTADQFKTIAEGLELNKLLPLYSFVLSGYIGEIAVMGEVATLTKKMISAKDTDSSQGHANKVIYICDPVCGDAGKLYVAAECVEAYRTHLLPHASIALPNGFEASTLSQIDITNVDSAIKAADWFHNTPRVPIVIIKSFSDLARDPSDNTIYMLLSFDKAADDVMGSMEENLLGKRISSASNKNSPHRWIIEVPKLVGYFVGTGDLFASLFISHYRKSLLVGGAEGGEGALIHSVSLAAAGVVGVLKRTCDMRHSAAKAEGSSSVLTNVERGDIKMGDRELKTIHCQECLVTPDASLVKVIPL